MRTLRLCLSALLFLLVTPVHAQLTCMGRVEGVPGQANKPPHWWDMSPEMGVMDPQPAYFNLLRDPRWVRAGAIGYSNGMGEDLVFRSLHDTNNVYLSWWAKSTPFGTPEQNILYFGFPAMGGGTRIVKITLGSLTPVDAGAGGAIVKSTFLRDPMTGKGQAPDPEPGWMSTTARVWVSSPLNTWGVQVRIPKSEIAIAADTFKLWYQLFTGTVTAPVVRYTWPRTGASVTESAFPVEPVFPDPSVWQTFRLSSGPSDATCASTGVSVDVGNVGTHNTPANRVFYKEVPPAAEHPENVFFARPSNFSGSNISAGGILATFMIANWGSMPNWEDGVPLAALWSPIECGTDISPNVTQCGTDVPSSGTINNGALADGTNEIKFSWRLTNAQLQPFKTGARRADNCLLVELKDNAVGHTTPALTGLTFVNRSVRRNVIFGSASTFRHTAEIRITGVTPIAVDGRDVYIWAEKLNLPEHVSTPTTTQPPGTGIREGRTLPTDPDQLQQMVADGQVSLEQVEQVTPVLKIHVYHDTGETFTIGGVAHPVLRAQSGFEYVITHDGPVTGWQTQFTADGHALQEIGPDFYKVVKVPNNGKFDFTTTVRALAGPGPGTIRFFVDLGPNFPHGSFNNGTDGKWSINAGIERFITSVWSVEGILGYHRFDSAAVSNPHIWQLSGGGKRYFGTAPWHPFLDASIGAYRFDPGNSTKFGANVGGGVLFDVSPTFGIEGVYQYHTISTSGSATRFSTLQAGVRFQF